MKSSRIASFDRLEDCGSLEKSETMLRQFQTSQLAKERAESC